MSRPLFNPAHAHPAVRDKLGQKHREIVEECQRAIESHPVVIIGMAMNPHPRRARRALDAQGIPYRYLSYGSYLSQWRRRLALKMWTGWPTFPMIFVHGTFIGGASELERLIESGELRRMLSSFESGATTSDVSMA